MWNVSIYSWLYDGTFYREETTLRVGIDHEDGRVQPINALNVYPLAHADAELTEKLAKRGETFWKCRSHRLMSYDERASNNQLGVVS